MQFHPLTKDKTKSGTYSFSFMATFRFRHLRFEMDLQTHSDDKPWHNHSCLLPLSPVFEMTPLYIGPATSCSNPEALWLTYYSLNKARIATCYKNMPCICFYVAQSLLSLLALPWEMLDLMITICLWYFAGVGALLLRFIAFNHINILQNVPVRRKFLHFFFGHNQSRIDFILFRFIFILFYCFYCY